MCGTASDQFGRILLIKVAPILTFLLNSTIEEIFFNSFGIILGLKNNI
jgi:hypothetical protein